MPWTYQRPRGLPSHAPLLPLLTRTNICVFWASFCGQRHCWSQEAERLSFSCSDVQYELLRLASSCTSMSAAADVGSSGTNIAGRGAEAAGAEAAGAVLRASGYSPNPLDYSLSWLLAGVLGSLGLLSPGVVRAVE